MDTTKLTKAESELIEAIAKTDNENLMNIFLKWQKERQKCSEQFIIEIKELVKITK